MLRVLVGFVLMVLMLAGCGHAPKEQTVKQLVVSHDSVIEPRAINFAQGAWGTAINGQTFQIDAITSFAGWQYATYYNVDGNLCIARRKLPSGDWQRIVFADYRINHQDVHNVAVLGICEADGTIHLSYDHHVNRLHYRVSRKNVATDPESVQWNAELFSQDTAALRPGFPLAKVTYPEFFRAPGGRLQLYYRLGSSGDGDSYLAEYDPAAGGWSELGMFISRSGDYHGSSKRSAYHNGFDYDAAGRLHTSWVWREPGNLLKNHDLYYAWSDDRGRTWRNNAGEVAGISGERPMNLDTPGLCAFAIRYDWGLMNQVTQTIDAGGRFHVMLWQNPAAAPAASNNLNDWVYVQYTRETDGRWSQRQLPFVGRKPTLLADPSGDLYLVFTRGDDRRYHGNDPGGILCVAKARSATGFADWRIVYESSRSYDGEPRVDQARWAADAVLSIYVQEHPSKAGEESPLRAIDIAVRER